MNPLKSLKGVLRVEVVGVHPLTELHRVNEIGVTVSGLTIVDEITVCFEIFRRDYRKLCSFLKKRGCRVSVKENKGIYWTLHRLLNRPVLLIGMLIIFALTLFVPTRVLFVRVTGNQSVPANRILAAASECGINFGSSRRMIRSEKVKNALLSQLPQLKWLGVNTSGCTAVISVEENVQTEMNRQPVCISSIVASRDGVISGMTVSSGTPVCKVGQAVREGQLLVSGYSDCGICIHGSQSNAEIFADTKRVMKTVTPNLYGKRVSNEVVSKKFSLIIGKKRINLYKGSGIYDTTCGKMYEEQYITLPGDFQLPVALGIETWFIGTVEPDVQSEAISNEISERFSKEYLMQQMMAGTITNYTCETTRQGDADWMYGTYMCQEMIGQIRIEELIDQYEKNN